MTPPTTPQENDKPVTWAHLSCAAHIDTILDHAGAHPEKWERSRVSNVVTYSFNGWSGALDAAWRRIDWGPAPRAAMEALQLRVPGGAAGRAAAEDALVALFAWRDAADVFTMPPDAVHLLARCGDPRAILLHAATLAIQGE
jgi:hypothetical protein